VVSSVSNSEVPLSVGDTVVSVDPRYFRPTEVELLLGDPTKAKRELGWTPRYDLAAMCSEMVRSDIGLFRRDQLLKQEGFAIRNQYE
jgi:GDPmannose 4,6-dehydratase